MQCTDSRIEWPMRIHFVRLYLLPNANSVREQVDGRWINVNVTYNLMWRQCGAIAYYSHWQRPNSIDDVANVFLNTYSLRMVCRSDLAARKEQENSVSNIIIYLIGWFQNEQFLTKEKKIILHYSTKMFYKHCYLYFISIKLLLWKNLFCNIPHIWKNLNVPMQNQAFTR